MEWRHVRERDVARKIFEKGLEVAEYATTPEYILAYADFLCGACGRQAWVDVDASSCCLGCIVLMT